MVGTVSPPRLLAAKVDTDGGETYDLVIKRVGGGSEGEEVDRVATVDGGLQWGKDDKTVYYLKMDDAHRPFQVQPPRCSKGKSSCPLFFFLPTSVFPCRPAVRKALPHPCVCSSIQVWRHTVGSPASADELLFEETNELFWVALSKTLDGRFVLIESASSESSEVLTVDLESPFKKAPPQPVVVAPRRPKVLYDVDHREGVFYIVTNADGHANFRLVTAPVATPGHQHWAPLAMGSDGGAMVFGEGSDEAAGAPMLEGVTCFKDHLVLSGRANGFTKVRAQDHYEGCPRLL